MTNHKPLPVGELFRACDPSRFGFKSTSELEPLEELIGQDRAVEAVQFGIGINRDGYNLFAAGPAGTGKHTLIAEFLQRQASSGPVPDDWCYVYNFADSRRPKGPSAACGARAAAGDGHGAADRGFARRHPERHSNRKTTEIAARRWPRNSRNARKAPSRTFSKKARERSIALVRTPVGLALAPLRDGEVLSPEDFEALPEAEREKAKADLESDGGAAPGHTAPSAALGARTPRPGT